MVRIVRHLRCVSLTPMPSFTSIARRYGFHALGIAAATIGCSRSDLPPMGYVQGVVTLDGEPLNDAVVKLSPESGKRGSRGRTDERGRYQLGTFGVGDGAIAGERTVTISPAAPPPASFEFNPRGNHGYTPPFPTRYWSAQTSGFTVRVEAGQTNELNLELTSQPNG